MSRDRLSRGVALTAALLAAPAGVAAQAHDPGQDGDHGPDHPVIPAECTTLATPPWPGLPERDRQLVRRLEAAVASYGTPEAARAAGFRPALGNIPTMGVHWIHAERTGAGADLEEPDYLLFAPIGGVDRLVGVAFALTDFADQHGLLPFESDLAHWYDHPRLADPGETLHVLHVWFVPSSSGPFARNNFWLPYWGAGIQPPSACWMTNEETADRIQMVAMILAMTQLDDTSIFAPARTAPEATAEAAFAERLIELEEATSKGDRDAWVVAADRFIAERPAAERTRAEALLRSLTMAQMSSSDRSAAGQ
jgi:hypothetical protein